MYIPVIIPQSDAFVPSIVAIAAVTILLKYWSRETFHRNGQSLPMPESTLPILGNTLDTLKKNKDRLFEWITEESKKQEGYPWVLQSIGRPPAIVITSPELVQDVVKTQSELFIRGPISREIAYDFLGRGLVAADGDDWYFQRKTASHLFSLQMMQQVMHKAIVDKTAILSKVLQHYVDTKETFSARDLFTHFTCDVFALAALSVDLDCMSKAFEDESALEFINAFHTMSYATRMRLLRPYWLWKCMRALSLGSEYELAKARQVVDSMIVSVIEQSVQKKRGNDISKTESKDLLSLFFDSKAKDLADTRAIDMNANFMRDMVVNFIFAGQDTSSVSLSWFVVMMNRYPSVASRLRQELHEKFPKLHSDEQELPSIDELNSLTYLEAVIRENLRLNPPVYSTARTANKATTLVDGTYVPEGYRVMISIYTMARLESVWGGDAAEFKPERWINKSTGKIIHESPFKFATFLGGPRQCIGMKFAMLELKVAIAMMMSKFDISMETDMWGVPYSLGITNPVKIPLMCRARNV